MRQLVVPIHVLIMRFGCGAAELYAAYEDKRQARRALGRAERESQSNQLQGVRWEIKTVKCRMSEYLDSWRPS